MFGRTRIALAVAVAVVATLGAAPHAAADDRDDDNGPFLVVDGDKVQCPTADFTSILAAVTAAPPGSVIFVCPDTYTEEVIVPKTLTLQAVSRVERDDDDDDEAQPLDPARNCFTPAAPDPTRDAIVNGRFQLNADDIVVDGFVVQGASIGILSNVAFSGFRIRDNLLQDNVSTGVFLNGNSSRGSRVRENCARGRTITPVFGIVVDESNVLIKRNRVARITAGVGIAGVGIRINGAEQNVTVAGNRARDGEIDYDDFGDRNRWLGNTSVGAIVGFAFRGTVGLVAKRNRVREAGTGIQFGPDFAISNRTARVFDNDIRDSTGDAVRVLAGTSLLDSLLRGNVLLDNARDGIRIEAGANAGNQIVDNKILRNGEHDCHDDTAGLGTAGTANLWIDNDAVTSNRPGLCPPDDDGDDDRDDDDDGDDDGDDG
jgi:hypothetical protein